MSGICQAVVALANDETEMSTENFDAFFERIQTLSPAVQEWIASLPVWLWPRSMPKQNHVNGFSGSYTLTSQCGAKLCFKTMSKSFTLEKNCKLESVRKSFVMPCNADGSPDIASFLPKLMCLSCDGQGCHSATWTELLPEHMMR